MSRKTVVILLLLTVVLLVAGCSAAKEKGADPEQTGNQPVGANSSLEQKYFRSDQGEGGVQVDVVWVAEDYLRATGNEQLISQFDVANNIVFEIGMTTHSGDLGEYQIVEKAELIVDGKALKPAKWQLNSQDSHHPAGLLFFPAKDGDGKEILQPSSTMELNLRDLRGVPERKFTWKN